jgi:hypothetical protein
MRAARSGTEDLTVREASGDEFRDLAFDAFSVSGAGVGGVGFSGSEVNARGAEMADMTPPKAE